MTNIDIKPASRRVLFLASFLFLTLLLWYVGKWGLGNMVSTRVDDTRIADVAIGMAPGDPQTHYAAAVVYDRTFIPADQQRALDEYEKAVELAPNNYILWIEYGKALERNGDQTKAEAALRRASALAPNYAAVHWALGNLLVRKGDTDSGFYEIRKAIEGDPQYASSAAAFAYQYYNGDVDKTRQVIGTSTTANALFALLLAKQKRFDEAAAVWQAVGQPKDDSVIAAGNSLVTELISANKFDLALGVYNTLDSSATFESEKIHDGGFEDAIKLENASPFEWQIAPGSQPQILQSTSQPHGGTRSLVLRFSSSDGNGLRGIAQTVVVRPNFNYQFNGFYRSDIKSDSKVVWQVVDAATNTVLTELPVPPTNAWAAFSVGFHSPSDANAIILRLTVKGCGSALCPINGSIWIDDVELQAS